MSTQTKEPLLDVSDAPLPTKRTLKLRRCIILQFFKFLKFNATIMSMVVKGHKG